MYRAFWTQTPLGMAEFSDQSMRHPPVEEQYYDFFQARYVTEYLEYYVDSHIYNGKSIRHRILFSTHVQSVSKQSDLWYLDLKPSSTMATSKLIDATGMTSLPRRPTIPGQERFQGLQLHHKDYGVHEHRLLHDPKMQKIAVIGGAKSAADVAYACAKAGKEVSWVIRPEGAGPAAFLSAKGRAWYRNSNETFYTRMTAAFLPSPFRQETWLYRFLQRTKAGTWLVRGFWDRADRDNRRAADFARVEGKATGFANLEPDTKLFWQNDSSGINQRPDLFSIIATKVHVYRQSIQRLTNEAIVLSPSDKDSQAGEASKGEQAIPVDAIIYCTGWHPTCPHFSTELAAELGLSLPKSDKCKETSNTNKSKTTSYDLRQAVISRYPLLAQPPSVLTPKEPPYTPFQLYKAMAPLQDLSSPSIVFLGKLVVGNNFRVAEAQALWAVAYLDGHIVPSGSDSKCASEDQSAEIHRKPEREVSYTLAWCRQRYLDKGKLGNWFFFDAISYSDMLLAQLGLESHRGKGWLGWWKDLFKPCRARDLKGLAEEYKNLYPTQGKS